MFNKIFNLKKEFKPDSILVIFFGEFPEEYKASIRKSLDDFFNSMFENIPDNFIRYISVQDLKDTTLENREEIFKKFVENFQENIVLGITRLGIWSTNPHPRYIFGSALGSGKALFSTYRFEHDSDTPEQICSRIGKETLKILGIACGMKICENNSCLLSYHWDVSDLDKNTGVCEVCKRDLSIFFKKNI